MNYYLREEQKNFLNILRDNLIDKNDEVCFTFFNIDNKNIEVTREEILEKGYMIAAELKKNKAKKGDRVIILSTQDVSNIFSIVGSILASTIFTIIPSPIDSSKLERFKAVFKSCEPKFILCDKDNIINVEEIIYDMDVRRDDIIIINVDECRGHCSFTYENIDLNDTIYIQYTSGSTSDPKGVEVSYGNLLSAVNSIYYEYKFHRIVGYVPFFHNMGLVYLIFAVIINKNIVAGIIKPEDFLKKPSIWLEALNLFKADVTLAPNSVYESYPKLVPSKKIEDINLSSLELFVNGSEVVSSSSMSKFAKEYKNIGINIDKFYIGYGLSESTCGISAGRYDEKKNLYVDLNYYKKGILREVKKDDNNSICFVSCGKMMRKAKALIVNNKTMRRCKANEFGEIYLKSPCIAKGYYNDEAATKEFFNLKIKGKKGGYLKTGDIGIIKNNNLYITGRIKDIIIINGNNILPNDIIQKLKENIEELRECNIGAFSIVKDNKERLVIIVENLMNVEIKDKINSCIYEYFDISPYDIRIEKKGYIPLSDNGKISLSLLRKKYEDENYNDSKESIYNTETEMILGEIIEKEFSHKADRKDNLLSLGMDSLEVTSLVSLIEDKFDVPISVAFIFDNPSICKIGEYIDKIKRGEKSCTIEEDKLYLCKDVELEEINSINPLIYNCEEPDLNHIFITGSTGFLGAYLISELINKTKGKLYCLVRSKSKCDGFNRIKSNMEYYNLWNDKYKDNIIPIVGTLDEEKLGINEEEYDYLCESIDTIYHCGAILNFVYPYSRLRDTNVLGTIRTLELASTGKAKYYNYISSYSVYDNPSHFNKDVYEDDELENCNGYYLAYSESKWVCEKIIDKVAREKCLRAAIYRPGEISGDTVGGTWKLSDAVSRTIKAMIVTGIYPDIEMKLHLTQVDFVAEAITEISSCGRFYGKKYNILNEKYVTLDMIAEVLNNMGINVKKIKYKDWKDILFKSSVEHPLKLLQPLFKNEDSSEEESLSKRYGVISPNIHMDNTIDILKDSDVRLIDMNEDLLRKYIMNFI